MVATAPAGEVSGERQNGSEEARHPGLLLLVVGSFGVIYGDIGTSPLYAIREATAAAVGEDSVPTWTTMVGILSLMFWALILVVSLKYVTILLRADNNGEGGTLSLMALAQRGLKGRRSTWVLLLGMIGAALFYADATITPAISVLAAVEGITVQAPEFQPAVVPTALIILVALFAFQRSGTHRVSSFFGPITALWFATMAIAGIFGIARAPSVLLAINPYYAATFLIEHQFIGFVTMGAVFLAVTGSEAIYADLGHFGRRPIRVGWFFVVLPSLALNYAGQTALILSEPETRESPFFLLFPDWMLVFVVGLATAATIIASQAVISGAYSVTRQAIQLGLLPRMRILFTSEMTTGQIYMPRINWLLFSAVAMVTLIFGSSSNLASAYGIAVASAMAVDGLLAVVVMRHVWDFKVWLAAAVIGPFVLVDFSFVAANSLKIVSGGWVPILFAVVLLLTMLTWRRGTAILAEKTRRIEVSLSDLVRRLDSKPPHRVPGTAIFLTGNPDGAPTALLHNLKHNKIIHERNIILTIRTEQTPRVGSGNRVSITELSPTFQLITMSFGYMETPSVLKGIAACRKLGLSFDIMSTSFFMSRRSLKASPHSGMPLWQDKVFIALAGSADSATDYFHIPAERVVEIGAQVTI
jgi:KUP system potassium uptake protein